MNAAFNKTDPASLLRLATNASVLTALTLVAAKLIAWFVTGSITVLASLVDSLMDAAASLINHFAVRYSLKSADDKHQFGHGKAESLAGLAQASFIMGSAIFLAMHAIERLRAPASLSSHGTGITVMVFAIIATLGLLIVQHHVIKQTGSTAIRADSLHYRSDLLTNLATIAALFFAQKGFVLLDPLIALGIAGYILYSSWQIGHEASQALMDRELPEEIRNTICEIVLAHENVAGVHDLRTRESGRTKIIQLHLDLDDEIKLNKAHKIAKQVQASILQVFPGSDIIIHQDPVSATVYRKTHPESCD